MCGSTIDIQSATADNRTEKKKKKPQRQNIMACSLQRTGDHKKTRLQIVQARVNEKSQFYLPCVHPQMEQNVGQCEHMKPVEICWGAPNSPTDLCR